jgi:hypothetical protein
MYLSHIYFLNFVKITFILQVFFCKEYFIIYTIAAFTFWSPNQLLFVNITEQI